MRTVNLAYCASWLLLIACLFIPIKSVADDAILLNVNGQFGPAAENYIIKGLQYAARQHARVVILRLNITGGLDNAFLKIDSAILASPVPVITYIVPPNKNAVSSDAVILYASHVAAMAPNTQLSTPAPSNLITTTTQKNAALANKIDQQNLSAEEHQELNAATTNMQNLATLRGRNVTWGKQAVTTATTISANDALKTKVIDVIATDIPNLLQQVNGKTISVNGVKQTLTTHNLTINELKWDWRDTFLAWITNPNIAYILLLLGIYGVFFEFYHPGWLFPGILGTIAVIFAAYGFQYLPINYVGFAVLLLGVIFLMIEVIISSLGILVLAGISAFLTGSILLLDMNSPGYNIPWALILGMTFFTSAFFILIITLSIRAHQRKLLAARLLQSKTPTRTTRMID